MSTNYLSCSLLAILGGFLVVVSQAFSPRGLEWVAFSVAIAIIVIELVVQLDRTRGAVHRLLDAASVVTSGLLIAFAIAASGSAVKWLTFALALGVTGLAFTGLTVHEVSDWRTLKKLPALRWINGDYRETFTPQSKAA